MTKALMDKHRHDAEFYKKKYKIARRLARHRDVDIYNELLDILKCADIEDLDKIIEENEWAKDK